MDYGEFLADSFGYAKDAVWEKWGRWFMLLVSLIIVPLFVGYMMEIYRGKIPAPEPENWGKLFIDGLKLIAAAIIYMIPVFLVFIVFGGLAILGIASASSTGNVPALISAAVALLVAIGLALFVWMIISLVSTVAFVRLARTDSFGEAFNMSAIFDTIARIGWGSYIIAIVIFWIINVIFVGIISLFLLIPIIGWLIWLFLMVIFIIFNARYVTRIYDTATPEPGMVHVVPAP